MIKLLKTTSVIGLLLFVLSGCGVAAIYNVPSNPVEVKKGTQNNEIYKAIKMAGAGLGWRVNKVKDGQAQATLNLRSHKAVVIINYDSNHYSIIYSNSIDLNYSKEDGTIHTNYNGWIQNLEKAIDLSIDILSE